MKEQKRNPSVVVQGDRLGKELLAMSGREAPLRNTQD
jgi:hypothetical protein